MEILFEFLICEYCRWVFHYMWMLVCFAYCSSSVVLPCLLGSQRNMLPAEIWSVWRPCRRNPWTLGRCWLAMAVVLWYSGTWIDNVPSSISWARRYWIPFSLCVLLLPLTYSWFYGCDTSCKSWVHCSIFKIHVKKKEKWAQTSFFLKLLRKLIVDTNP